MGGPRRTVGRRTIGNASLALALTIAFLIPAICAAQMRTATTSVAITVERHAAILIPADAAGLARVSTGSDEPPSPVAIGNASPTLITVPDSRSFSPISSARTRVAVTVFEP